LLRALKVGNFLTFGILKNRTNILMTRVKSGENVKLNFRNEAAFLKLPVPHALNRKKLSDKTKKAAENGGLKS
jgi:hypothetical protein